MSIGVSLVVDVGFVAKKLLRLAVTALRRRAAFDGGRVRFSVKVRTLTVLFAGISCSGSSYTRRRRRRQPSRRRPEPVRYMPRQAAQFRLSACRQVNVDSRDGDRP